MKLRGTPAADGAGDIFMAHLAERDRPGAIAHVMRLVDGGLTAAQVVSTILGPAQREVGRLWEIGEWSVAQEHVASGITDDVLHALSLRQLDSTVSRGHIVLACMEGEYHAMPARMLAEVLRGAGFGVTFLGASLPADSLPPILRQTPSIALALSCSLSPNLLQVGTGIDIAHALGVPVICGGAAFGSDGSRARGLGADAWAADAAGAIATLQRWATTSPRPLNVARDIPEEEMDIATMRADVIEQAVGEGATHDATDGDAGRRATARLRRNVGDVVDHLAVAVRLDDVTVLSEYRSWAARLDAGASGDAFALVAKVLPRHLRHAHRLLADAADGTHQPAAA